MKIYRLILLLFLLSCQKHEDISFEKIKLEGVPISDYFLDFLHKDTDDFYKNVSIYPEDSQKVVYLSEQNMKYRFCKKFHIKETEIDYFIDNVAQITIPEEFFNVQIKKRFRITLREIEKENPILSDDLKN